MRKLLDQIVGCMAYVEMQDLKCVSIYMSPTLFNLLRVDRDCLELDHAQRVTIYGARLEVDRRLPSFRIRLKVGRDL